MKTKKFLTIILTLVMIFSVGCFTAFAQTVINEGDATFTGDNVVFDGTNYYTSFSAAVAAVEGKSGAVLYCKADADFSKEDLNHLPVTATLTIYGNGATVPKSQTFDIGNTDPNGGKDVTGDMTFTVYNLNNCAVWCAKATEHTVNIVVDGCTNMGEVYLSGTTGTLNISLTDCTFTSNDVSDCKVYSNANGAISLNNVTFSNVKKAVNLNHKVAGTQTVSLTNCSFTDCGSDVAAGIDQIPVRILSSVEGGKTEATITNCSFSGTPEGGADILLDYGVGTTTASISGTAAKVGVEKEENTATYTTVTASETITTTNMETAITISSLDEFIAFRNAVNGGDTYEGKTVTLTKDIDLNSVTDWTPIGNGSRSGSGYSGNAFKGIFNGDNKTISNLTITSGESAAAIGLFGVVDGGTVKNLTLSNVNINASSNKNAGAAIGLMVNNATADNIAVSGLISAADGVGGVIGRMTISGTVLNCVNSANVSGAAAGGIVGKAYYTGTGVEMNITNCTNSGTITGTAVGGAGGIVGFSATNVSDCINNGTITSNADGVNLGGIVGWQQMYGEISGNTNNGSVTSDYAVTTAGGIGGWVNYQYATDGTASEYPRYEVISVTENTNNASIIAEKSSLGSGGIVGGAYNAVSVTDNTNYAETIIGSSFAAGILGNYQSQEANGYNGDKKTLVVTDNTTYTKIENITANCINVVCYDNVFYSTRDYTATNTVITATPVAKIGDVEYETLKAAITAAVDGDTIEIIAGTIEEDSILFPATLNNVTIKGAADKATVLKNTNLGSANGSAVHYNGITIDGIVFDGSQIVFTGARGGEVIYKDWTITNCEFKNIVSTANSAVHFNLASDEVMENFTFTNNTIDSVSGGNISGVRLNYLKGSVTISGNNISNVAWNAVQLINGNIDTFVITNNTLSSGATEGILNLYNINAEALIIAQNKFLVVEGQPGIAYLNSGDVSENYWGGFAPTGLPEGVTYSSYYTDSELTNLVQSSTTKTLPTINLLIQNMPTGTMTDANGETITTYRAGCFAAIDSTAYSVLGIEVRADGGKVTGKPTTEYLYTYITVTNNGVDTPFYPKDFGETNKYIFGRIIETPTNYTDFCFRPFAVSLDGKTTFYGEWSKEYTVDPQE